MQSIIVLGAGPAGVASAIGLKKLGYELILISKKRPFDALEGFSARTLEGLEKIGCENALKSIGQKVPRLVNWNNITSNKNFEFIVERKIFDAALLEDARKFDIQIVEGGAKIIDYSKSIVEVNKKRYIGEFIVDARGRFAPRTTVNSSKPTNAFLLKYKQTTINSQTSLSTSKHGWLWQASDNQNNNYIQLTADTKYGKKYLNEILKQNNQEHLLKTNQITTREASSYLSKNILTNNYIRIGDASCAVDPLSGNGVFQALSTALISPYIIHTLLYGEEEDKNAAKEFFTTRVEDIFYRYTRMGREFYSQEQQYESEFWKERAIWPDNKDSHETNNLEEPYIEKKAILISPFIKSHEVVISNEAPMGIWRMGRINLVKIVKELLTFEKKHRKNHINNFFKEAALSSQEENYLLSWCEENNLIKL